MSVAAWIGILALGCILARFLLKIILSFAVPQTVSGVLLFKQELSKYGIPHSHLPPEFFSECIAWCELVSRTDIHASALKRKADFVSAIETLAQTVSLWRTEPGSPMFQTFGAGKNGYREMFEKYDIR